MRKLTSLVSALIIAAGVALTASPAHARRPIRDRLYRERARIQEGVDSGELSPRQADRLERQLDRNAYHFRRAHHRGHWGDNTRDTIQDNLDRISGRIRNDRSNARRRGYGYYRGYGRDYHPYWRY